MARLVASFFGAGLILRRIRGSDSGSGTVGGLFAAVGAFLVGRAWGFPTVVVLFAVVAAAGMWAIRRLYEGTGDAGWIVVDEAAGAVLALIGIIEWPAALAAFVVFRLADIFKRTFPGVEAAEEIPGPVGVIADDLVAGLYGLLAGHLVQWLV